MSEKPTVIPTGDGSNTLYLPEMDETYHSINGAITEANHVFIKAGLAHWYKLHKKAPRILEVGFGTGLNALLTNAFASEHNLQIGYTAIEQFPLSTSQWKSMKYGQQLKTEEIYDAIHESPWETECLIDHLRLEKIKEDYLLFEPTKSYDIIYFDAFAPSKQPELWTPAALQKSISALESEGIFVTYSAKGQLKRDLKSIGMRVESPPGPPGKFQMTRGSITYS